jgi:hypothetical protein
MWLLLAKAPATTLVGAGNEAQQRQQRKPVQGNEHDSG